eukprot:TRINITY_DN12924_c0_g1_i1.p2 TRINITY_DN12924_c0_g1~~TRINITY_DN12924_c0_g1_i1.p2  ORF type:complete len:177 (-),score=15.83 TRINITY_DN12924_c0_g1_i1:697-1227(-)
MHFGSHVGLDPQGNLADLAFDDLARWSSSQWEIYMHFLSNISQKSKRFAPQDLHKSQLYTITQSPECKDRFHLHQLARGFGWLVPSVLAVSSKVRTPVDVTALAQIGVKKAVCVSAESAACEGWFMEHSVDHVVVDVDVRNRGSLFESVLSVVVEIVKEWLNIRGERRSAKGSKST